MKWTVAFAALIVALGNGNIYCANPPYARMLSINFSAPAFDAYVSNASGQRAGIDPDLPLNSVGQQFLNDIEHGIKEIPGSSFEQANIEGNQTSTMWETDMVNPTGTYLFNYTSAMSNGAGMITVGLTSYSPHNLTSSNVFLLAQKSVIKHLEITLSSSGITVTSRLGSGDFLRDTQSACGLGQIGPVAACGVLEILASGVEKAMAKGDSKIEAEELEVYLFILDRLHFWGQKGLTKDWHDLEGRTDCAGLLQSKLNDKFFAKDPAYSALKLDAETLLVPLKKPGDHDWRDDHSWHK